MTCSSICWCARELDIRPISLESPFDSDFMVERVDHCNHYAVMRIRSYQAKHPGKWVMLTGIYHTRFVPGEGYVHVGVAPRTNARSVNIEDVDRVKKRAVSNQSQEPDRHGGYPDITLNYPMPCGCEALIALRVR